ncbi:hypothetical protein V6C53_20460, partial [Desulfocurvibacter africanus]|uniref:hypothetical protein n=1 Tax=Desulfocurvibacter africanus TaxID=873 RepID=UPI002FD96251
MSSTSKPPYGNLGGKPIEDVPLLSGSQPMEDVPAQSGGTTAPGYTFTFVPHNPFAGPRPSGLRPPGAFLSAPPEPVPIHKPRPVAPDLFVEGDTTLKDYGLLLAMGLDDLAQFGGRNLKWMGFEDAGQAVEELYAQRKEQAASGLSPAMRREMSKQFLEKDEDAPFGYKLGSGATSAPKILGAIVQSAPQLLVGGGVSKALKGMLIARGLGPRLAALIGSALGEGVMDGALAKKKTEDTIMNADIGYLSLTPEYRDEY